MKKIFVLIMLLTCFLSGEAQVSGKVLRSINPFLAVNPIPDICTPNDTAQITIGFDPGYVIVLSHLYFSHDTILKYDSTMFIPDGPACPVQCYNSSISVNVFDSADNLGLFELQSICVNMEHSYSGDLGFRIICPNGQSVQLDPNSHAGGAYLGEPYGGANHAAYDSGCDPVNNSPGVGWTYCWSEMYPQAGTLDNLSYGTSPINPTNTINNTNYITPVNPLSGLVGCPLNGTWTLEVCDDFGIDNGYIFWWELNFDPALLPNNTLITLDTILCSGPFIQTVNDSVYRIVPDSAGLFEYVVTIVDGLGNSYDTTVTVNVTQTPDVNLGSDTILCGNNLTYILDAGTADAYFWSTGNTTQTISPSSTGYYIVNVENFNPGHTLACTDRDTVHITMLVPPSPVDLGPDVETNSIVTPVILDAGNLGFKYLWNTGDTTQTIVVTTIGYYCVTVAEEFGYDCEEVGDIYFGPDAAIDETNPDKSFIIYPNPANNFLIIQSIEKNADVREEISIYNLHGQQIIRKIIQSEKNVIDISTLSKGIYYVKLESEDGIDAVKLIIKE